MIGANFQLDKKKLILILLIAAAVLYLEATVLLKGQYDGFIALKPKIAKVKKDLQALDADLKRMKEMKAKQAKTGEKPAGNFKRMIFEPQKEALLEDIADIANKHKVTILQMKPVKETVGAAKGAATAAQAGLLINMELACDYHNLGYFLNDLENGDVIFSVQSMKIKSKEKDYLKQAVSLVLKTYVKK
jgi:Tfp pilus assembly protein PilO